MGRRGGGGDTKKKTSTKTRYCNGLFDEIVGLWKALAQPGMALLVDIMREFWALARGAWQEHLMESMT